MLCTEFFPMPGLVVNARAHALMQELAMELSARNPPSEEDLEDLCVGELNSLANHVAYQDQVQQVLESQSKCSGCDNVVEGKFVVGAKSAESQVFKFGHRLLHAEVCRMR